MDLVFVDGYFGLPRTPPVTRQQVGSGFNQGREGMIRGMFSPATTPAIQKHILAMMLTPAAATAADNIQREALRKRVVCIMKGPSFDNCGKRNRGL